MPTRVKIPDTVESAIPSVSAISAAVKRSRRSFTIASTRSGRVRFATLRGADERSHNPAGPSSLKRLIHFRAQRTLTPEAAAAAATVQPSTTTSSHSRFRPVQLRAALACRFIRDLLGVELPLTALSLQGGPDEPTSSGTTARSDDAGLLHPIRMTRPCPPVVTL